MLIEMISFLGFASAMVATPGPANLVLMASGAAHGARSSVPFLAGVILGKQTVIWSLGLGLALVFAENPVFQEAFKWLSAIYVLWLAWRIMGARIQPGQAATPPSFLSGLIVHPMNPKAWAMVLAAMSAFAGMPPSITDIAWIAAGLFVAQCVFQPMWMLAGSAISDRLAGTRAEVQVMRVLALLLVTSVAAVLFWEG